MQPRNLSQHIIASQQAAASPTPYSPSSPSTATATSRHSPAHVPSSSPSITSLDPETSHQSDVYALGQHMARTCRHLQQNRTTFSIQFSILVTVDVLCIMYAVKYYCQYSHYDPISTLCATLFFVIICYLLFNGTVYDRYYGPHLYVQRCNHYLKIYHLQFDQPSQQIQSIYHYYRHGGGVDSSLRPLPSPSSSPSPTRITPSSHSQSLFASRSGYPASRQRSPYQFHGFQEQSIPMTIPPIEHVMDEEDDEDDEDDEVEGKEASSRSYSRQARSSPNDDASPVNVTRRTSPRTRTNVGQTDTARRSPRYADP